MAKPISYIFQIIGTIFILPLIIWSRLPLSQYSSFTAPSQILAIVPGFLGILIRRAWYKATLKKCGCNLTVDWLAVIRTRDTEIGNFCTLGVGNWIGWARIGDYVITGSHVTILSGAKQHSLDNISIPIRNQSGQKKQLVIEDDIWIGANAVIMTNIATGTVIGAGSIVTKSFPPYSILAGNPAKILRTRQYKEIVQHKNV